MTTDTPVTLTGVTRRFGSTVALDDVSLTVRPGEIVGLLGPNGAGKTALLSLVEGLRRPDSGTVRLFGLDPREPAARVRLGTTPQETGLPPNLKVSEVVDFVAAHYPDPVPTDELLATFGLTELAGRQTGGMSGGQKRRLAVALAVVGRPDLVLLDEPTTGLDVDAAMSCGTRCARSTRRRVSLDVPPDAVAMVRGLDSVVGHEVDPVSGRHVLLTADADAVVRGLVRNDIPFLDLEVRSATLEEAFLALTTEVSA